VLGRVNRIMRKTIRTGVSALVRLSTAPPVCYSGSCLSLGRERPAGILAIKHAVLSWG